MNKLEIFHRAHVSGIRWPVSCRTIWKLLLVKNELECCFFVFVLKYIHNLREMQNVLVAEVALQTQHRADSGGDPNSIDWIALFEKVLGAWRRHVRGIGPKPSVAGTSAPT